MARIRQYRSLLGQEPIGPVIVTNRDHEPLERLEMPGFGWTWIPPDPMDSSPLDPATGHWEFEPGEGYFYDPSKGWIGPGGSGAGGSTGGGKGGGSGEGGGGTGTGAGGSGDPGNLDPVFDCPKIAGDQGAGFGQVSYACKQTEIDWYKWATRSLSQQPWSTYFKMFHDLWPCVLDYLQGPNCIEFDCTVNRLKYPGSIRERTTVQWEKGIISLPPWFPSQHNSPGGAYPWIEANIAYALVKMCGGNELDATVISMMNGIRWKDFPGDLRNLAAQCNAVEFRGKKYLKGNYVWWNPGTGDVGSLPYPDYPWNYDPVENGITLPYLPPNAFLCPTCI